MKRILGGVMFVMFLGAAPLWVQSFKGNEYEKGKTLYRKECQLCHGLKGDGKGPAAQSLLMHPADFTDPEFWKDGVEKVIAYTIINGKEMMPAFDLKPGEIQSIVWFMSHTFNKKAQNDD